MSVQTLPPMTVEFLPNTGCEVGWQIALQRALTAEGWRVWSEVDTADGRHVDLVASIGGIVAVIEIKGKAAGPAAVFQLNRYLDDLKLPGAIGVLAAPSLACTVAHMPDDIYFLPLVRA